MSSSGTPLTIGFASAMLTVFLLRGEPFWDLEPNP